MACGSQSAHLILVYIYAFFKFTWSAWQYNVLSIMVGALPKPGDTHDHSDYTEAAASVLALAEERYNNGIRAYYFSIPRCGSRCAAVT